MENGKLVSGEECTASKKNLERAENGKKTECFAAKKGREAAQHKSGVFEEIWSPEMQHFGLFLSVMHGNRGIFA